MLDRLSPSTICCLVLVCGLASQTATADTSLLDRVISDWRDASAVLSASSRQVAIFEPDQDESGQPQSRGDVHIVQRDEQYLLERRWTGTDHPRRFTRVSWDGDQSAVVQTDVSGRSDVVFASASASTPHTVGSPGFAGPTQGYIDTDSSSTWWQAVQASVEAGAEVTLKRGGHPFTRLEVAQGRLRWTLWIDESSGRPLVRGIDQVQASKAAGFDPADTGIGQVKVSYSSLRDITYQDVDGVLVPTTMHWEQGLNLSNGQVLKEARTYETGAIDLDPFLRGDISFAPQIPEGAHIQYLDKEPLYSGAVRWVNGQPQAVASQMFTGYFDDQIASIDTKDFANTPLAPLTRPTDQPARQMNIIGDPNKASDAKDVKPWAPASWWVAIPIVLLIGGIYAAKRRYFNARVPATNA
ncbi:MAG: hypothetical protein AAF333_08830 [Planctomycetota bacterium]